MTTVLGSQAWSKFGSTDAPEVDEYPLLAVAERIQLGLGRHHGELRRDSDPNACMFTDQTGHIVSEVLDVPVSLVWAGGG